LFKILKDMTNITSTEFLHAACMSVSEQFLNGTSARKRPFNALQVLCKSNYVEEKKEK